MSAYPQLGTLYYNGLVNGLPYWSQPLGAGTQVFPAQTLGERVALFVMPFCEHWQNNLSVQIGLSAPDVRSAFIMCSLCSCVVRVLTPSSLYNDNTVNFILLP